MGTEQYIEQIKEISSTAENLLGDLRNAIYNISPKENGEPYNRNSCKEDIIWAKERAEEIIAALTKLYKSL